MKAAEYLQNAIDSGITKPVYFRGFNHHWESKLLPIKQALASLDTDFSDEAQMEIELSQSGIDVDFPYYLVVYFLD